MKLSLSRCAVLLATLGSALVCFGQAMPDVEQGMKPYGSYHGGAIDSVSLTNGNLTLQAGLMAYSQRGGELAYPIVLRYNGKNFSRYEESCPPNAGGCPLRLHVVFGPNPLRTTIESEGNSVTVGFEGFAGMGSGMLDSSLSFDGTDIIVYPSSAYTTDGAVHQLAKTDNGFVALDGSGFASPSGVGITAVDRNGTLSAFTSSALDRHGNQVGSIDTLGRQIAPTPGPAPSTATPPTSTASLSACPALNYGFQPATYAYTWSLPTVGGGTLPLILCYTGVYVRTGPGTPAPPIFQVSHNFYMLQSVVLPDNTYWAFQYDAADPNNTSSVAFGDLLKLTFPTGGSIAYTWAMSNMGCSSGYDRAVQTRTVDANDGTGPHTWHYNGGIVTDPLGNDTVHVITGLGNLNAGSCSFYETQTQYYQGSHSGGTLLKTVNTDYQYTFNPYDPGVIGSGGVAANATTVTNVFPIRVTTTLPNGLISKVETDYDNALAYHGPLDGITWNVDGCPSSGGPGAGHTKTYPPFNSPPTGGGCWEDQQTNGVTNYTGSYGKVIAQREYDWGQGAPGPLLRQTSTTYQWQVSSAYLTANLLDLPATVKVLDGAGHLCAETDYFYDEPGYLTTPSPAITTQHTTAPWTVRGNLTTTTHKLSATPCAANATWSSVSSHTSWFDTGEIQSTTDPLGHTTTHSYDSVYAGAHSTKTCNAKNQCVSGTYDFNTGLLTSLTNANATQQASGNTPGDAAHTTNLNYDNRWRMTSVVAPPDPALGLSPETDFDYSVLNQVKRSKRQDSTHWIYDYAYFDGVGRTKQTRLVDPAGDDFVDTTYDAVGQPATVSNPHRSTASTTDGVTQTQYDALGRGTQVTRQDGSISTVSYSGNCVTTTDEAGKQRKACSDALGRLIEVDEPGVVAGHNANNHATMQSDGNFVLYSSSNAALWSTGTSGSNAGTLDIQDDGNMVLYVFKWQAGVYAAPSPGPFPPQTCSIGHVLSAPQNLASGQCITSPQGQYMLYMQPDGQLVIYNLANNTIVVTWSSGTYNSPGAHATMQSDGNLVVYSTSGAPLWSSGTSGTNSERLEMENDGRILIYKSAWNSGTAQSPTSQTLPPPACNVGPGMGTTGTLNPGQCLVSFNGLYELLLQADGNLVLYNLAVAPAQNLWSTNTALTPFSPGVALTTLYTYDTLGNLTCVEQHGDAASGTGCGASPALDATSPWRVRRFTYDSLSRLLTAHNPESGTITYTYDADSNMISKTSPAPNQTGSATQTISFCYDELHRPKGKAYGAQSCPLTTPVVTYTYDAGTNGIGHLTSLTDQAGSGSYTFDILGRPATETRIIAGISKNTGYAYNLDGSVKALTYPSGRVVNYTYNSAGQALTAIDGNSTQYVGNSSYWPSGAEFQSWMPNIYISRGLNSRLQTSFLYSDNGHIDSFYMSKSYGYNDGHNNGNVMSVTNNKDNNRTQTFTYDGLNRITAGWASANSGAFSWGENYTIDAWGNLQMAPMAGKAQGGNFQHASDGNNHATGLWYDAAGNLTGYTTPGQAFYDSENRLQSVAGTTYTYDADGERVLKSTGSTPAKMYWSAGGNILAEGDGTGNLTSEYVYFGGKRTARIDLPAGTVHYYLSDHLNSTSQVVSSAGVIEEESDYSPFGTEVVVTGPGPNHYKFTGKERDSESGLDYFGARYYSNGMGRFITPDWSAVPVAVPYADLADPQSLNQYSYVRNIPTTNADPDGHCCWLAWRVIDDVNTSGGAKGFGKDVGIGAAKGTGSFVYHALMSSNPITMAVDHFVGEPRALQGSNQTQTDAKVVTVVAETVGTMLAPGPKGAASEGGEAGGAANAERGAVASERYSGRYSDGQKGYRTNVPRDANGNPEPLPEAQGAHSRLQPDAKDATRTYSATEFDANGNAVRRTDFAGRKGDPLPHSHDYNANTKGFDKTKKPLDGQ